VLVSVILFLLHQEERQNAMVLLCSLVILSLKAFEFMRNNRNDTIYYKKQSNVQPASQSTINLPSLTMRLKKTISSTGLMPPSLASVQSTEMRGASPSATATTVFLTRCLRNVSRTGSSEYQLHLMKISDRDRNVNKS